MFRKSLMMKWMPFLFAISVLISCGGGGGGGSAPPPPPDTEPPIVSTTSPLPNALQVPRGATISATFSEPMNNATITSATFSVAPSAGGSSITGTFSFSGATATFTPSQQLTLNTAYIATISTGVKDLAGNALQSSHVWSFTTQDKAWGSAALIESSDGDVNLPKVAIDNTGNAMALWYQYDSSDVRYKVYANYYSAQSKVWSGPTVIDSGSGSAIMPHVGVDGSGNFIVVWIQLDGSHESIYANRYVPGTGWGTAALIETGAGNAYAPRVAVNASGVAVAVWHQYDSTGFRNDIYANRYIPGTGWGTAERIETGDGDAESARVAIDVNGNAVAVWKQRNGSDSFHSIFANRYAAGSGWGSAQLLEALDYAVDEPEVAIDGSGNAVAVWYQRDAALGPYKIWAARYAVGSTWGTAQAISSGSESAATPRVGMDASGNALVVWYQYQGVPTSILAARYVAGTGWSLPVAIESGSGTAFDPDIAVNSSGNAVAVWKQHDYTTYSVYANQYTAGSGWGTAGLIEAIDFEADDPAVAINNSGSAVALWRQRNSTIVTTYLDIRANVLQ